LGAESVGFEGITTRLGPKIEVWPKKPLSHLNLFL
jgi:hypothetical protein